MLITDLSRKQTGVPIILAKVIIWNEHIKLYSFR